MSRISELRMLFLILESPDHEWPRERKIQEIKFARESELITSDEAIDLAVEYSTEWQRDDYMKEHS